MHFNAYILITYLSIINILLFVFIRVPIGIVGIPTS